MTYIYAQIDNQRRAFSVTQAASELEGADLVALTSFDESVMGRVHNAATGQWEAALPQQAPRKITPLAFRRRFTKVERASIEWAAVDKADQPDAQRQLAAALRADLKDQEQAQFIDLDEADVALGLQTLEAIGLLAVGRAAAITGAPVLPEELP